MTIREFFDFEKLREKYFIDNRYVGISIRDKDVANIIYTNNRFMVIYADYSYTIVGNTEVIEIKD